MSRQKIIINNQSSLGDEEVLRLVGYVIRKGRISDNGRSYCYLTSFPIGCFCDVLVYAKRNKTSDTFVVYEQSDSGVPAP